MRVALIVPGFSASADDWAIPALQLLASELARAHEVVLFSLRYPAGTPKQFGGLRHVALGGGTRRGLAAVALWRRAVAAIGAAHRQQPFDVLHAFWADEAGLVAGLAGRWLSRPVLVSVAGGELVYLRDIGYGTQRSWFRRRVVGAALRLAGGVTAGSAYQMALCQAQGVPAGRLHLAPLGLDTAHFTPAGVVSPGPLTLVQAASLVPVKNQRLLLAVLQRVRAVLPETQLILAGEGPLAAALHAEAQALGVAGGVRWLDKVAYPAMPAVYRQGHLYVQTSRHEAQGMAVLESMACGLPLVGTPVGVARDLAYAPAVEDPAGLAAQIVALAQDHGRYARCRAEARAQAVAQFSLPVTVARYGQLYDSVMQLAA